MACYFKFVHTHAKFRPFLSKGLALMSRHTHTRIHMYIHTNIYIQTKVYIYNIYLYIYVWIYTIRECPNSDNPIQKVVEFFFVDRLDVDNFITMLDLTCLDPLW